MYENDKLDLRDIWSTDWAFIQAMIIERENYKKETAAQAERMARLSGKSAGTTTSSKFPSLS